jgi:membrane protein
MFRIVILDKLTALSKKIVLPGFDGVPLYDVGLFFYKGLSEGFLTARASAVSFNFFLAIFPTLLFLFTIIPMIPIRDFQVSLLELIREFMPASAYETVHVTIEDIITRPHAGWFSVGFLLTLYFSTNGIYSLMEGFNNTYHSIESRGWFKLRIVSLTLLLVYALMMIVAIGLITFGYTILEWILPEEVFNQGLILVLLVVLKWIIILAALFFAISCLYYLAPAKRKAFRFISAGSTVATLLVILTTLGFNFYVDNFARYNVLYGSIGTLLVILLWIYFNAISLLLGFELNASINNAKIVQRNLNGPCVPLSKG